MAGLHPELVRVCYFGSYARGDWGVGSDLDLLVIVDDTDVGGAAEWDTSDIPVPVDLLLYTVGAWERLDRAGRFHSTLMREAAWVFDRGTAATASPASGMQ